jgi:hypothetical protein
MSSKPASNSASLLMVATCLAWLSTASSPASAHGGGLNADGCHTNRKTGEYHCHRAKASSSGAPRQLVTTPKPAASAAFANCSEARAAGAAPVRRGDPGYGAHLDRDGDGVGCE